MMSDNCLFCKIINSEIPANIVAQTEHVLAFRDINPQSPIHILLIPKKHIASSRELNAQNFHYLSEIVFLAQKVAIKEKIMKEGYRWVINTGDNGGQTVDHIHLHLKFHPKYQHIPGFNHYYYHYHIHHIDLQLNHH